MNMNRDLDGVYFRIKREEKWDNICFSDLTESEMNEVLKEKDENWTKSLTKILNQALDTLISYIHNNELPYPKLVEKFQKIITSIPEDATLKELKENCKKIGVTIRTIGDYYDIRGN